MERTAVKKLLPEQEVNGHANPGLGIELGKRLPASSPLRDREHGAGGRVRPVIDPKMIFGIIDV